MGWLIFLLLFSVIFGVCLGDVNQDKGKRRLYLIVVFTLLALFAGLRGYEIGIDTINYANIYKGIYREGWSAVLVYRSQMEIGFLTFIYLLSRIFSSPTVLFLACAGLTGFAMAKTFYNYSEDVVMSTFVYIAWFYTGTMNIMRQYTALAIILLGLPFVLQKKPLRYLFCVGIAATIHSTAILFAVFAIFGLQKIRINRKVIALSIVFAAAAINFFEIVVGVFLLAFPRYQRFLSSSKYMSQSSVSMVWMLIFLAVGVMAMVVTWNNETYRDEIAARDGSQIYKYEYQNLFLILYLISIVLIIFSGRMWIVSRMNSYFRYTFCLMVPMAIKPFYGTSMYQQLFVKTSAILFFTLYGMSMFALDSHEILPYVFFWS